MALDKRFEEVGADCVYIFRGEEGWVEGEERWEEAVGLIEREMGVALID